MQTILDILKLAGGFRPTVYLKVENPPYMALVIEATPEPVGRPKGCSHRLQSGHRRHRYQGTSGVRSQGKSEENAAACNQSRKEGA